MGKPWIRSVLVLLLGILVAASTNCSVTEPEPVWPARILLTNDNGIDDPPLIELARALSEVSEVWVAASVDDQSGVSNYATILRKNEFEVESRDLGANITAYAVHGTPADCVFFAMAGPMRESPPDLVISGINGGPNLADAWIGSGTIGAARTAAYIGVPAIAVSGVNNDPAAIQAAVDWVVTLAGSEVVRQLEAPQYLTVSLPVGPPEQIQGVEIVRRARGLLTATASQLEEQSGEGGQRWRLVVSDSNANETSFEGTDVSAVSRGYIAVVPMRADESDDGLDRGLRRMRSKLPVWPKIAAGSAECAPIVLGVQTDDVEEPNGREWGVYLVKVLPGGTADAVGLQQGDILVTYDGSGLAEDDPGQGDPEERLAALLARTPCGKAVTIEFVRDRVRKTTELTRAAAP